MIQERPIPAARGAQRPVNWPPGLRNRILTGAIIARETGRPVDPPSGMSSLEAFRRTVRSMDGLLTGLTELQWTAETVRGLSVQGLVGHLIGVERDFYQAMRGVIPAQAGADDHVAATQGSALEQLGKSADQTLHEWRQAIVDTLGMVRGITDAAQPATEASMMPRARIGSVMPAAPVTMHGVTLPLGDLLVVRAFEMWTHEEDILRATGRPLSAPDDATLALICRLAATLLPFAMTRGRDNAPAEVRLVLTGRGGGTFTVHVGPPVDGVPGRARLIMDTVQFCRVVANRLGDEDLTVDVSGDVDLAFATLAGARSLALD